MESLRAYFEKISMRGIQRIVGLSRTTLSQWLKDYRDTLPSLEETLKNPRTDDVLELDELWSYIYSKDNKRWIWIALRRRTRRVLAYFIGARSSKVPRLFGKGFLLPIEFVRVLVISGMPIKNCSFITLQSAKIPKKRLMLSVGTVLYVRDLTALLGKHCISQHQIVPMNSLFSSTYKISLIS